MSTSGSKAFEAWWSEYQRTGSLGAVQLGISRDDLRSLFGEPDALGGLTRRKRQAPIWLFRPVEFHFTTDGRLFLIYTEDEEYNGKTIAVC